MSVRAAVAQTLIVGVTSPSRAQLRELVRPGAAVGGIFLAGDGRRVLTDGRLAVAARAAIPPLVAADDEGGRVQRIAFASSIPSARTQAATMSPGQVRALAEKRGRALRRYGVTMDLAPVVDLGGRRAAPVIGDRAYSGRPQRVTRYAGAFAAGLRDAGVLPALKHFPGHGHARGDSHRGRATTPPAAELRRLDWAPYRDLAGPGMAVMMGHLQVPGLSTPGLPASVDPRLYRVLRGEVGFGGLVVTDELAGMQAIRGRFGLHDAVRRAIAAGADLALFNVPPERVAPLLRRLVADVRAGRLAEDRVREAAGRVLAVKGCR
jgi:beta-N-acetylhexosaminidase